MPEIDKWIEEMKNKTLYEAKSGDNLPQMILEQSPTNSRYNEKMARYRASMEAVFSTFKGDYAGMFDGFFEDIVTYYRSLDGWSVLEAIEAEKVRVEKEIAMQKKGLLGIFGGGDKSGDKQ